MNGNKDIDILSDRNLTTDGIDKYIEQLNINITNAIEHGTNNYSSTDRYITSQIKKTKSQLISNINKLTNR